MLLRRNSIYLIKYSETRKNELQNFLFVPNLESIVQNLVSTCFKEIKKKGVVQKMYLLGDDIFRPLEGHKHKD